MPAHPDISAGTEKAQPKSIETDPGNFDHTDGEIGRAYDGEPILPAYKGTNADLLPKILRLYLPEGSVVADVTYGCPDLHMGVLARLSAGPRVRV
jgi:hypothetical protein